VRYLLRVLALDPFDEEAHLGLIATLAQAGMYGEARRAYRRYVERMSDIGLEPAAYEQAAASH
jgi:DNA-binding SARP family transcriptional activator